MLLEFTCSNHKSIRNTVLFSTVAGKDTTHEDSLVDVGGVQALRSAVIYGANGSGKSNFLGAIAFVKDLITNSINFQPGQGILQMPHKLDGCGKNSTYRIQFIKNGTRYVFGFSLRDMLVSEEYLYYFPNGKQTKIFERDGGIEFTAGRNFRNKFNVCRDVLKPNRLLLSCAANFSSVQEVSDAFQFFRDDLVVYGEANHDNWMNYSLYQMNRNEQVKQAVLTLLDELGTGIKDIMVSIDQEQFDSSQLPPFLSDEAKAILLQQKIDAISATVKYDRFETDLITEESTGIRKLFGMLCPLIDIMVNGKVLVCDELESGLHESLVCGLVKLFVRTRTENRAQLIFTTHETSLLSLDLFRRDQIWFTEMTGEDRATDLYSLAEIKNVRKDDNVGKGYILGKYGAIPMLNIDFANVISKM